jgi:hypothetical protein
LDLPLNVDRANRRERTRISAERGAADRAERVLILAESIAMVNKVLIFADMRKRACSDGVLK